MRASLTIVFAAAVLFCVASWAVLAQNDDPFASRPATRAPATPSFDAFAQPNSPARSFADGAPVVRPKIDATVYQAPVAVAPPEQTRIWASPGEAENEPIRKKLAGPLTSAGLDFPETPLEEVIDFLRSEYEIVVQIDTPAFESLGVTLDDPINCKLSGVKLGAALRLLLGQIDCTCVPVDGYLLITTEEQSETILKVAVYPVGDLVSGDAGGFSNVVLPPNEFGRRGGRFAGDHTGQQPSSTPNPALLDAICSCVSVDTWAENGGGEADLRLLPNGMLIVSQTEEVHHQISALLEAMRKATPRRPGANAVMRSMPPPPQRQRPLFPVMPPAYQQQLPQRQENRGFGVPSQQSLPQPRAEQFDFGEDSAPRNLVRPSRTPSSSPDGSFGSR